MRSTSLVAPDWWDYTTLEDDLIQDAARLTEKDLAELSRPGFRVVLYDTLEDFYLAEALEYVTAWRQATESGPVGICGPIGPTEQLPLVARLVNELDVDVSHAHFWGMDEWVEAGRPVPPDHPLSFRHPTYWHVRGYGLFTANPFGVHDFKGDESQDGSWTLKRGEAAVGRFRLILHPGRGVDGSPRIKELIDSEGLAGPAALGRGGRLPDQGPQPRGAAARGRQ